MAATELYSLKATVCPRYTVLFMPHSDKHCLFFLSLFAVPKILHLMPQLLKTAFKRLWFMSRETFEHLKCYQIAVQIQFQTFFLYTTSDVKRVNDILKIKNVMSSKHLLSEWMRDLPYHTFSIIAVQGLVLICSDQWLSCQSDICIANTEKTRQAFTYTHTHTYKHTTQN